PSVGPGGRRINRQGYPPRAGADARRGSLGRPTRGYRRPMRVVVTGATGNVGTSVLASLGREPAVTEIVGLARRVPRLDYPKVTWCQADVTTDPLRPIFDGADAVIHLA